MNVKTLINNLSIPLYMDCFNFNCEKIIELLTEQLINTYHFTESKTNDFINDNLLYIQEYVREHQPKSFKDYIGITQQQLAFLIQQEIIRNIDIKELISIINWPRNADSGMFSLAFDPITALKTYYFSNDDFDMFAVLKKVYPKYKKLRYVNFDIKSLYKFTSWNKTFALIASKLLTYVKNKNENIKQILINHHQKINKIEDTTEKNLTIDFNTQAPYLRDAPIVVMREFLDDNKYEDHVLIGERGQHHMDLIRSYPELYSKCKDINNNEIFTCAYLHGLIAFVSDLEYNGYSSLQEVANIIKDKEPNILKVFSSPPNRRGGDIHQLAKIKKQNRLYHY